MKSNQCVLCHVKYEWLHEFFFEFLNTILVFGPLCGTAVVWIPIGRGEQGFFFAVWSTSKPIKLFEMFAYVTLPNGV